MLSFKRKREAVARRKNNGPPFKFLVPLVYAPVLPLSKFSHNFYIFPNSNSLLFWGVYLFGIFVLFVVFSVRISLRHRPVLRDRLFTAVLAGAFAHGFYLVYPFYHFLCDLAIMLWLMVRCIIA